METEIIVTFAAGYRDAEPIIALSILGVVTRFLDFYLYVRSRALQALVIKLIVKIRGCGPLSRLQQKLNGDGTRAACCLKLRASGV